MNSVINFESLTGGQAITHWPRWGRPYFSADDSAVAARIPRMIEPRTRRACNAAVTNRPKKNTIEVGRGELVIQRPAACPGLGSSRPALSSPISTMNMPMPTAMPLRMLGLTASRSFSRTPSMESSRKITPE